MFAQQLINGIVLGSIYALAALGFTLIFGVAKVINFAYGEMLMLGAFLTLMSQEGLQVDFFTALVLGMAAVGILSMLIYQVTIRPVLRGSALQTLLITTGLLYTLREAAILIWGTAPRQLPMGVEGGVEIGDVFVPYQRLIVVAVTLLMIITLYLVLYRSRIGKALRAVAQNAEGAVSIGLNVSRTVGFGFAISGVLACAAGGLLGALYAVQPQMGGVPLLKSFVIVIFGGLGSIPGAIIGAMVIGLLETFAGAYISFAYKDLFAFLIMILILLYRPYGLLGVEQR
jgi:branched-chain amino acid transport system permease protein